MSQTMSDSIAQRKSQLRLTMKDNLKRVSHEERRRHSLAAAESLFDETVFWECDLLLAFLSMPDEIDTAPVLHKALSGGKDVAVPRIAGADIEFCLLEEGWQDWPRDRWNIPVPPAQLVAAINQTDCLALVPALAFDERGGRLGRGKGYYDRFLSGLLAARDRLEATGSLITCGYGYDLQVVEAVPQDDDDQELDMLVTG